MVFKDQGCKQLLAKWNYMSTPDVLWRAFIVILNFPASDFFISDDDELLLITNFLMKNSKFWLSTSCSGIVATREKTFHTLASVFSKIISNNIRKCTIHLGVSFLGSVKSTVFSIEMDMVKEHSISDTNLARFIDLLNSMVSNSLKWSHKQY